jgi:hypothetical protein
MKHAALTMACSVIPWSSPIVAKHDKVFAITSTALFKLCNTIGVSPLFLEQILEDIFWAKHGTGLFLIQDDQGQALKLGKILQSSEWAWLTSQEIFYRYSFGLATGRSFIYTMHDLTKQVTTNLCVNLSPKTMPLLEKLTKSSFDDPFALHTLILSESLDAWIFEGTKFRGTLIKDVHCPIDNSLRQFSNAQQEGSRHDANPKLTTLVLHRLSQQFHILLEDMNDLEDRIILAREANELFRQESKSSISATRANKLAYLLSKCRTTKRWVTNYKDRTNIRINLVRHLLCYTF